MTYKIIDKHDKEKAARYEAKTRWLAWREFYEAENTVCDTLAEFIPFAIARGFKCVAVKNT